MSSNRPKPPYKTYNDIYRRYPFLNMLSKKQIIKLGEASLKQGDIDFHEACHLVVRNDTTRFKT